MTYLIICESYKLMKKEEEKITSGFSNVIRFTLDKDNLKDIVEECNFSSLFEDKKCVIVRCMDFLKGSDVDFTVLEKYLECENENCILILESFTVPDKRKKIYKRIDEKENIINIEHLKKKDLMEICRKELSKEGYSISLDDAYYIVNNSYDSYDIMTNELEKIYLLKPDKKLTKQVISNIISSSLNGNVYEFLDAILYKDIKRTSLAMKDFETLKIDSFMILVMLAKEYQILYLMLTHNNREVQMFLHKEEWQLKKYQDLKYRYSIEDVKKIIIQLADYDYKLKSGQLDEKAVYDLILLEFAI